MSGMNYIVALTPEPDGSAYNVTVPALPGCFTWGETVERALENAREAIAVHLSDESPGAPAADVLDAIVATVAI